MICPFCKCNNIQGADECEGCGQNLSSLDGVQPEGKIEKVLMKEPVSCLSPRKPIIVDKRTTVHEAVHRMNEGKFGCVLVEEGDRLVGIMTERDVVFKALGEKDLSKTSVEALMTADPETLSMGDTLAYAVNKMAVGKFRHVPIVQGEKSVGVISVRDVLFYLSKGSPKPWN